MKHSCNTLAVFCRRDITEISYDIRKNPALQQKKWAASAAQSNEKRGLKYI